MNIQDKKIELIQWLSTLNDESVIEKILELRDAERTDWWEGISEKEKESIAQGIKDADSGKFTSQSEIRKSYEKWL